MTDGSSFGYRSFEISDFLKRAKKSAEGDPKPKVYGSGLSLEVRVYLADSAVFVPMQAIFKAGRKDVPASYRAAFLLANERVRGVDCSEVEVKRHYRIHIPKGWHQNLLDPNLDSSDPNQNRHEVLEWTVTDFDVFTRQVCKLWNIDLGREEELL